MGIIAVCIGSFAVASDWQNQKVTEKVHVMTNQKNREKALDLTEKIEIYTSYDSVIQKNNSYQSIKRKQEEGKSRIGDAADRELKKLEKLGLISMNAEDCFVQMENYWEYQINTYVNGKGEYTVVWELSFYRDDTYLNVMMESETEKIIEMQLNYNGVCPNYENGEGWLKQKWEKYLELDMTDKNQVKYFCTGTENEFMVIPEGSFQNRASVNIPENFFEHYNQVGVYALILQKESKIK